MTERLADIGARIAGIRQLGAVVNAMRGIAAARLRQARGQLVAVDHYAAIIATAIARAEALLPPAAPIATRRSARPAIVLFCAEQGFAGAFSERVLDAAGADLTTSEVFLIGTRGAAAARERGIAPNWQSAMPSHSAGIPKIADRIAEALYARIATAAIDRIDVLFTQGDSGADSGAGATRSAHVERIRLLPLDTAGFPHPEGRNTPLSNLAPHALVSELTTEYLHARLCNAALHAFAAENEARMNAMESARHQIERHLAALQATERHVRQEAITAELIELAAGETASRPTWA